MPPNSKGNDALRLVVGGTSFYGTICIAQLTQGLLGVTRSYLVVSSALGCGSVIAGCCATAFCTDLVLQVGNPFFQMKMETNEHLCVFKITNSTGPTEACLKRTFESHTKLFYSTVVNFGSTANKFGDEMGELYHAASKFDTESMNEVISLQSLACPLYALYDRC